MSTLVGLDRWLFAEAATLHTPFLDEVLLPASHIGARAFVWIVVALILFVFPARRPGAWRVLLAVALTGTMVSAVVKPLVDRPRPYATLADVRVIDTRPTSASFPSGHAANAFAGALAVSRVLPAVRLGWWVLAIAIAASRVYVGVHYPLDILGGAAIGFACAWLVLGGAPPRPAPPMHSRRRADE